MSERVTKLNCWEFKKCGRQPQGVHVKDLGLCPAAVEDALDGLHDGTNAGRTCWVVSGTLCKGVVQGPSRRSSKTARPATFTRR